MTLSLVGDGPAADAVAAALADVDAEVVRSDESTIDDATLAVVVGRTGTDVFERADEAARDGSTAWIAVELGGLGGYPVVDAAVAGLGPERCYDCLSGRVAANVRTDDEPTSPPDVPTVRFAGAIAGRAAVQRLTDDESVVGTVIEVPYREREFLPLPNCDCGDSPARALDRSVADVPLQTALDRAERALDDRVGVVTEVGEVASFPVPYYLAQVCDTSGFSDATAPRQAAGVATGWDEALMKGLGESLERYAAGVYREADFTTASMDAVEPAVAPAAFVAPEDDAWSPDEPVTWTVAENVETGEPVHVPASEVHYPPPGRRYRPAVTTGLGLGSSPAAAILAGLYEVIERDAAMLSWYSSYDPLGLAVDDESYETLARRASAEDLDVTPLLLTQDVDVPVVAVAVHRESWPRFAVGSAADLDPAAAAVDALREALQNWMELDMMGPDDAADQSGAIGEYASFPEAAREFVAVEERVPAEAVGPTAVPPSEAALDAVVDRLAASDLSAYAARITTRDLATLGFEAVRVLVPAAQPLFFDDPFFGERAERVPAGLGFEPRLDRVHHPFP